MTYVFDIDGTICTNTGGDYNSALPFADRIEKINQLYDDGNTIHFLTARGMGRSNNAAVYADRAFRKLTEQQLSDWGVKYHKLFLGKPAGGIYIDDTGIKEEDFFNSRN